MQVLCSSSLCGIRFLKMLRSSDACLQFWEAAAATVALNRVLVLPRFVRYCDEGWKLGRYITASLQQHSHCDGSQTMLHLHKCSAAHCAADRHQESTCAASTTCTKACQPESGFWSLDCDRARSSVLDEYKHHKVLHFEESGHVLLDYHWHWSSRRAHATYTW